METLIIPFNLNSTSAWKLLMWSRRLVGFLPVRTLYLWPAGQCLQLDFLIICSGLSGSITSICSNSPCTTAALARGLVNFGGMTRRRLCSPALEMSCYGPQDVQRKGDKNTSYCVVCYVELNSLEMMKSHSQGSKHKKMLAIEAKGGRCSPALLGGTNIGSEI